MQNKRLGFIIGFILLLLSTIKAEKTQIINWDFYRGNVGSLYEVWRDSKISNLPVWESITVPHSFNAYDAVDPDINYYQGPAWYRTYLNIDNIPEAHKLALHFEGAGQKTEVYIGTQLVGTHIGGYNEFRVDITQAVLNSLERDIAKIPLAVKTDNSRDVNMIPSDLSDFTLFGGLYRKVWLELLPELHIGSVFVRTELDNTRENASVTINLEMFNQGKEDVAELELSVFNQSNEKIFGEKSKIKLNSESLNSSLQFDIKEPNLWSQQSPDLYTCQLILKSQIGDHKLIEKFGIRDFKFIENGPFLLNGDTLFLRGTHRHEDHAGYGAAMPDKLIREEMKMMKDMGVNFIRLGHYQQSELVLDLCDSLGILVWEEIPWCRGGVGNSNYKEQANTMLRDMIEQHFNHPSVILWGLGNEQDWPGDFDWYSQDSVRSLMHSLNDVSHKLDSERKTCIRRCDFAADIVDVYSPSVWAGWYRGKYTDLMKVSEEWNQKVPHFFHAEWGASHHPYRHSNNPDKGLENITSGNADEREGDFLPDGGDPRVSRDGDWSVTYACNLIDWHLKEFENMPWHTGAAYWPFKDFATPLRPENPIPYVNQKGVVERDLTPKESYYVFQSYWAEKPMLKIYGHTWTRRSGDKDDKNLIKVYSNLDQVELLVNGKSMGVKNRNSQDFPAAGLRWISLFKPGENTLVALSHDQDKELSDTLVFYYQTEKWTDPVALEFYKDEIKNGIAVLYVQAVDQNGTPCLDCKNSVEFSLAGTGKLIDNLGTMGGSRKIQLANGQAFIRVNMNDGENTVAASSKGLQTGFIHIK